MNAAVLLVGAEAEELAPRLRLSGYRTLGPDPVGQAGDGEGGAAPDAVVLAPDQAPAIGALRRRYGAVPLLLGIPEDSVEGRCHCLTSGADDFWLTGRGASDLLTRLRLGIHRARQQAEAEEVLQLADLQVWPARRLVRRGRRVVTLTSREYELLLLLLRHRGSVVDRSRIHAAIWPEHGGGSNVIEVYVRYLRRKLEAGGERRLLHTVRGRGYCLAERLPVAEGGT